MPASAGRITCSLAQDVRRVFEEEALLPVVSLAKRFTLNSGVSTGGPFTNEVRAFSIGH
jgi:hypothetical protein